MPDLQINPSAADVLRAYRFLRDRVICTPTEYSYPLSSATGGDVWLKWESQQLCGSFKIRGALNKMNSLSREERKRGVVTSSSGNHGQGVAYAAALMGVRATVFVPGCCPETKRSAIKNYGGEWVTLIPTGEVYDDAEAAAHEFTHDNGATYVSSYEDAAILAGAGTAAFEMLIEAPDIDLVVTPAGGGGLVNGTAVIAKAINPDAEIWGVQSEASNPWVVSWESGTVQDVEYADSLADGLTGLIPQSLLSLAKTRLAGFAEVTEREIADAIAFAHREHHQIVEGAGAVGIAALLSGKIDAKGRKVGVIISGRNIDEERLMQVLKG